MHVMIGYPDSSAEKTILELARNEALVGQNTEKRSELPQEVILGARKEIMNMHMAEPVEEYLLQLILATRNPTAYGGVLSEDLEYGASPRATIALDRCARAHAWLHGRDYVSPDDVQAMVHDCLRHRLILSFEAEADGRDPDKVIDTLLELVPVT